jgi:hypothetical protein
MLEWYRTLTAYRRSHSSHLAAPVTETRIDEEARTLVVARGAFTMALNLGLAPLSVETAGPAADIVSSRPVTADSDTIELPPQTIACFLVDR